MEIIVLVAVLIVFGALAAAFGVDSRASEPDDWESSATGGSRA